MATSARMNGVKYYVADRKFAQRPAVLHQQGVARGANCKEAFQVLAFGGSVATWLASAGVVANK